MTNCNCGELADVNLVVNSEFLTKPIEVNRCRNHAAKFMDEWLSDHYGDTPVGTTLLATILRP